MKERYEVTIGIPVYKSANYIQDTMTSALNQSFPDIEFLIVDDCGNDGSIDLIMNIIKKQPRGDNVRIINNGSNKGVSYSRNLIIDEAKGKYLYFLDSDDTIEPDTIQLLYDAIVGNQAQIAYGSYDIIESVGNTPIERYQKDAMVMNGKDELAMYAFKNNHLFQVTVCNHLVDISFLRQSNVRFIDVSYWEDMAYTVELVVKVENAVLLPDITYHYFRRPDSLSHYQYRDLYDKTEILLNAFILKYLKDKCIYLCGKSYLPYLCYYLEMISYYTVCNIAEKRNKIVPPITNYEMRTILQHPMTLKDILLFKERRIANLFFLFIGSMPLCLIIPAVRMIGKIKNNTKYLYNG